jgi:putative transposase
MLKLKPTEKQIQLIEEIFDVTRYLYNKTNALIKKDINLYNRPNDIRDKFVTIETKKNTETYINSLSELETNYKSKKEALSELEKLFYTLERKDLFKKQKSDLKSEIYEQNEEITDFEKRVSKSIRDNAVRNVCSAYKTAITNLKEGNIKFFNIGYKLKTAPKKCAELSKTDIKISEDCKIRISPSFFGKENCEFNLGKRNIKKYGKCIINNNCDLLKRNDGYYIGLLLPFEEKQNDVFESVCGVDPGVRTFLTSYGSNGVVEYNHNREYLEKLNKLLRKLKESRKKRIKKKSLTKIDKKKENFITDIHWKAITELLKSSDVIFFGDIKSHGIVKDGKNKTLNRQINDLKFYVFKQRLKYKANTLHKKIVFVNEAYTTQGCSNCGNLWREIGCSKIYSCVKCKSTYDRDINSAKNILMKGLLTC